MMKHTVNNITFDMFEHMTVCNDNGVSDFAFTLLDGGVHTVSFEELPKVFEVITSVDFGVLLNLINEREDVQKIMHDMFNRSLKDPSSVDFYEYGETCMRYGGLRERVYYEREYLKDKFGWQTWVSVCRVYEALSGTPREWIS